MRLVALLAFSLSTLLCPGFITAQQNSPTVATEDKLPSDMRIPAILKVTLSSKKSKVGDPVKLEGFGRFQPKERPKRWARNLKSGEKIPISERRVVTFHPSKKLTANIDQQKPPTKVNQRARAS